MLPHKPWPTWHVFIALTDDEVAFLQDRLIKAECLSLQSEEFLLTQSHVTMGLWQVTMDTESHVCASRCFVPKCRFYITIKTKCRFLKDFSEKMLLYALPNLTQKFALAHSVCAFYNSQKSSHSFSISRWYKQPTRCNNNNLLVISISSTCFGR